MKAYRGIAYAVAVAVLLQAAFVAYAWFAVLHDVDKGAVLDKNYTGNAGHTLHGIFGMTVIPVLALALLVASFFVKRAGASSRAAIVLGLVVLQVVLALVSFSASAVGALHGLNAFALLGAALYAARLGAPGDLTTPAAATRAASGSAPQATAV